MDFKELGLCEKLVSGLAIENIKEPTGVQEKAVPLILEGKSVILQSETGSGKTLSYLLPIYERQEDVIPKGTEVLVLVPTKELAMQVHHEVERLSANAKIGLNSMVLFGDVNITKQIEKLKTKPQIIIGTSDRILELIKKKKVSAHTIKTLVIDEADKMLDIHYMDGVRAVRKTLMRDTQVVMASASITQQTLEQAKELCSDPQVVNVTHKLTIPQSIEHLYIVAEKRDKLEVLRKLIGIVAPQKGIIFINKLEEIDMAEQKLQHHKLDAACIHGMHVKQDRKQTLADFMGGKLHLLIATDLAARGLHIEGVDAIFHVSIAENPMDYLHRAGRTGRNGAEGLSIAIATEQEIQFLKKYESKFNIHMKQIRMYEGKILEANAKR